jgi:hypothetical protein
MVTLSIRRFFKCEKTKNGRKNTFFIKHATTRYSFLTLFNIVKRGKKDDFLSVFGQLERYSEGEANAVFVPAFQVLGIAQATYIIDTEESEDVFDAGSQFHVWHLAQLSAAVGKQVQPRCVWSGDVLG